MHTYLIEMLQCPICHGKLVWSTVNRSQDCIEAGRARCTACATVYPVRQGIGLFLAPELQRDDLWEQESRQVRYVREHPQIERQLLESPLEALNPADQHFRAQVLETRGEYAAARAAAERAQEGLYTPASRAHLKSQFDIVSGTLLAISVFLAEEDEIHGPVIREAGLEAALYRSQALAAFAAAGWQVEIANARLAKARPTPRGVLLEGVQVDGFPLAETTQESCVLVAR